MAKKPYSPVADYTNLKRVEEAINSAESVDRIREIVVKDGPQVGYKAFCYILGHKMTPEAMKPEEACTQASIFEQEGKLEEAMEIYKKVLVVHPDHPIARAKIS
jgi:hypothetical protein